MKFFFHLIIGEIRWQPISDANAVLTIFRKNFFTGTKVIIGDTTHDSTASGLIVKSDNTLELRAPLKELTAGREILAGGTALLNRFRSHRRRVGHCDYYLQLSDQQQGQRLLSTSCFRIEWEATSRNCPVLS